MTLSLGTGVIKFTPIFQELKRQNFNGMFSIERENNWYHNVPDVIATVKFYNDEVSKLNNFGVASWDWTAAEQLFPAETFGKRLTVFYFS